MSDNILVVDDTFREVVKMASNRAEHLANQHRRETVQHGNGWKLAAVLAAVCDILNHPDGQAMQSELNRLYAATPEAREE
jgi:hypothetical protein